MAGSILAFKWKSTGHLFKLQNLPPTGLQGIDFIRMKFQSVQLIEMPNGKRHDMAPLIAAFLEQLGADYAKDQLPDSEALRNILAARPIFIDQGKGSYTPVDLSPIAPALHLFLRYHIEAGRLHPTDATVAAEAEAALAGRGGPGFSTILPPR